MKIKYTKRLYLNVRNEGVTVLASRIVQINEKNVESVKFSGMFRNVTTYEDISCSKDLRAVATVKPKTKRPDSDTVT